MKKSIVVDKASTPDGGTISLHCHDGAYSIRVDGAELMSTRRHHSEEILAEVVCKDFANRAGTFLVGGLGFGFTLQAVLQNVSAQSRVVVVEILPSIIKWNKDPSLPLAYQALGDPRTEVVEGDVAQVVKMRPQAFDGIMLDVDNGPEAFTLGSNHNLYGEAGLKTLWEALRPGGGVAIWSAFSSPPFEKRMHRVGFRTEAIQAKARPGKGSTHTLYVGYRKT